MHAVRFHAHGDIDVLKYEEAPEPKIEANEVLVKVKACALNHLDLWLRQGVSDWKFPLPHIVGSDISGEVVARQNCSRPSNCSPGASCEP